MVDTSDKFVVATDGPGRKINHLNAVEELKNYDFSKWSVKEVPRTYPKTPRETERALSEGGVSELAQSMESVGVTEMTANPENLSDAWDLPEEDDSEEEDAPKDWDSVKEQIAKEHGEDSFSDLWKKAVENERDTPSEAQRLKEQARLRDNSGWKDVVDGIEENIEESEEGTEPESPSELSPEEAEELSDRKEEAARAFADRGGVWSELAEDIRDENPAREFHNGETQVIPREGGYKEVSTSYGPLLEELADCSEEDLGVDILEADREKGECRAVVDLETFESHFGGE